VGLLPAFAFAQGAEELMRMAVDFDSWTDGGVRYAGFPLGELAASGLSPLPWDLRHAERDGVLARYAGTDGRPAVLVRATVAADADAAHAWLLARLRGVSRAPWRSRGMCDVGFVSDDGFAAWTCGNVGVEVRVAVPGPVALDIARAALDLLARAPRGTPPALRVRARLENDVVRVEAPAGARIDWRPTNLTVSPLGETVRVVSRRPGGRLEIVAVDPLLRIGRTALCP